MGLFSNLFGSNKGSDKPENLQKSAVMLDEDLYWSIVADSLGKTVHQDDQEQYLISRLTKLSPEEIIGFRLRTDKLLYDTYTSEMWCAGYIMNGGCSDDSFEYFRNWVISRGKDVYYKAKTNPDSLINQVDAEQEMYDFEGFWYVAVEAFQIRTGKDLYDYIDYENFGLREGQYPSFEFTWEEENPDSMKAICPELFKKMWK